MSPSATTATLSNDECPLKCRCGDVQGIARKVRARSGTHVLCHCEDCQTFARFLETPGILDDHGGTRIFQLPPARVQITNGRDQIRCLRLSPNGTYRFYTACCRTPIGNMKGPGLPFIGIIHAFMDIDNQAIPGPCHGVFGKDATAAPPDYVADGITAGIALRVAGRLLWWWLRRDHRPNEFFDLSTGELAVPVDIMPLEERDALRGRENQPTS